METEIEDCDLENKSLLQLTKTSFVQGKTVLENSSDNELSHNINLPIENGAMEVDISQWDYTRLQHYCVAKFEHVVVRKLTISLAFLEEFSSHMQKLINH